MPAGVRLKDSLKVAGSGATLFLAALPHAASATPLDFLDGFGFDARSVLVAGIFSGSMVFAVFAGGIFLRAAGRARRAAVRARESADQLDRKRISFGALIAAEPQVLVQWDGDGAPVLVAMTLDATLGVPGTAEEIARFAEWLEPDTARELEELTRALLESGESYSIDVGSGGGVHLQVTGRVSATGAILKIRDIAGDGDEGGKQGEESKLSGHGTEITRSLFDALPMPVWFRDEEGRLEWVNDAYARAVEAASADEVCDKQIEFLSARQRAAAAQKPDQGKAQGQRIRAVVSGERREFDIISPPGEPASAGLAIDATALETAQNTLSSQIEENNRTLDRITTPVAIFSPGKSLKYFNQAFADLWKLEDAWLAARPSNGELLDLLRQRRCLPEQADYRAWKEKQLGRYESSSTHEDRWHLPDGRTIQVVANFAADGSATYLYENITEQLAMKSRYNALIHVQKETLDHLREGVAVFGTDGRLKLYNPAFAKIWKLKEKDLSGEPHIDEVIGWCRVLLDDDAAWAEVKCAITSIDDERAPLEGHLSRPDGSMLAYAGLPLPDGATLLTYVDITDSKRVENVLIERNEALLAAGRLKSAFISHVSYELRTPLTNIIGFAELLTSPATGALNERQREYLGDIQSSSDALLTIINDILDLATIDAGTLELSPAKVRTKEVIDAAIAGVRERLKVGGLELKVQVGEDAGDFVADGKRMTQVLFNLLSNAIGFSERGGTVTIGCRREGEMVSISVEDQGRGIPEDYQECAFDRFESRSQGSHHRGAGLGLAIVKNLVELHGGTVSLRSEPGVGTTVTLLLPVQGAGARSAPLIPPAVAAG